ncbi:MAG: ABC-type transport auxiliary lipoprotein family protein [Pseudomonadota bacterium]
MNPSHLIKLMLLSCLGLSLLACSTSAPPPVQLYDFGQLTPATRNPAPPAGKLPAISLADISSAAALDSNYMLYRLQYEDGQQPRSYAQHRWSMTPAQLLAQRLKMRVADAGGTIVSATDGAASLPLLRIELDDFSQLFSSPASSVANISLRASVFRGRNLVAQQSFTQQAGAGPDAPSGAKAMAAASDALIHNIILWMQGLPLN